VRVEQPGGVPPRFVPSPPGARAVSTDTIIATAFADEVARGLAVRIIWGGAVRSAEFAIPLDADGGAVVHAVVGRPADAGPRPPVDRAAPRDVAALVSGGRFDASSALFAVWGVALAGVWWLRLSAPALVSNAAMGFAALLSGAYVVSFSARIARLVRVE
jgi:hypothetical protein